MVVRIGVKSLHPVRPETEVCFAIFLKVLLKTSPFINIVHLAGFWRLWQVGGPRQSIYISVWTEEGEAGGRARRPAGNEY